MPLLSGSLEFFLWAPRGRRTSEVDEALKVHENFVKFIVDADGKRGE